MNKKVIGLCVLCLGFYSFAHAQIMGEIDYCEGIVQITRNGENLKSVDIGTKIENLDLIKTSVDGVASITFNKNSGLTGTVQIMNGTTALIRQDQITGIPLNEVQLMAGSVGLKVKKLAGIDSRIQVRSPSAVLGVRGTEFVVSSFNGSSIVACKEGEVFCAVSSSMDASILKLGVNGSSAIPGTMCEIVESGKVNAGTFPEGDFEENWKQTRDKWQDFNVNMFANDPVTSLNQYISSWKAYSVKVDAGASTLRSNIIVSKWLKDASTGRISGTMSDWVQEKPIVMKDLIDMHPDMMVAMLTWYRLQELIPCIPQTFMGVKLANGQTVKAFVDQYYKSVKSVASSFALFNAAEKQYMLRNDGSSPFSDF